MVRMPSFSSVAAKAFPDAPDQRYLLVAEKIERLGLSDDRKAARLFEIGGDLGEELAVGKTDRDRDADLLFHAARELRQNPCGTVLVQPLGARQVEKRLVDGDRLHQGGEFAHHLAHLFADPGVFLHVGLDDDGVRAGVERLEHRHRRPDTPNARDVATGRDHAAPPARRR
jgi:hypothetical protein